MFLHNSICPDFGKLTNFREISKSLKFWPLIISPKLRVSPLRILISWADTVERDKGSQSRETQHCKTAYRWKFERFKDFGSFLKFCAQSCQIEILICLKTSLKKTKNISKERREHAFWERLSEIRNFRHSIIRLRISENLKDLKISKIFFNFFGKSSPTVSKARISSCRN